MVPHQAPPSPVLIQQPPLLLPPLTRGATLPLLSKYRTVATDRTLLAPEDAIYLTSSPPRRQSAAVTKLQKDLRASNGAVDELLRARRAQQKERNESRSRRNRSWKKLLWIKQSYPDNYTDQATFLEELQRNPRLQPYNFWPLVADSTVIVQHVCSVIVFVVCFVGIFQERISPVSVVSWGSIGTVLGWVMWDRWVYEEEETAKAEAQNDQPEDGSASSSTSSVGAKDLAKSQSQPNLVPDMQNGQAIRHAHSASASSIHSQISGYSPIGPSNAEITPLYLPEYPVSGSRSSFSHRNQQRLATAKSAILIFCALLGLSPILKSLTRSTSEDSIWAISCWLMIINVFSFDYRGGVGVRFPASLSTNAGMMASTVLASRLPSTEHVFSLTLFAIEVFGLFPVFRRHLRHMSWRGHVALTAVLVMAAGGGVGSVASGGGWTGALVGVILGNLLTGLAMGGASWWLIGLQKYKNEIYGPWDPARPVIRRRWGDFID